MDGDMSGQGGIGEPSELSRGCGSSGVAAGIKGEMEFGPSQGECLMGTGGETEEPLSAHFSRKSAIMSQFESKALGLDKAILHSIDCCGKIRLQSVGRHVQTPVKTDLLISYTEDYMQKLQLQVGRVTF